MEKSVNFRRFLVTLVVGLLTSVSAFGQFDGAKITFFAKGSEDKKIANKLYVSEPIKGAVELPDKGGEFNVYVTVSWTKPLAANTRARILILDEKGSYRDDLNPKYFPKSLKEITWRFRIPKGTYTLNLVSSDDQDKVYASAPFSVVDKVGTRATGNQKAGTAKLWVCQTVDDDWKPVGATGDVAKGAFTWPENKPFELLVTNNSVPFGVSFLGIIIHKQGADGKDASFVTEFQTEMIDDKKSTKWCTVNGLPGLNGLPAGVYSIYVISWDKRETLEHRGNLTEIFGKITLTVK